MSSGLDEISVEVEQPVEESESLSGRFDSALQDGEPPAKAQENESSQQDEAQVEEYVREPFVPLGPISARVRAQFEEQLNVVPKEMAVQMYKSMDQQEKMMRARPNEALISATKKKVLHMVKMILEEYGADINAADNEGNTSIMWAAWFERPDIVEYLCGKGADLHIRNAKQQTALHWAAMAGLVPSIKHLLKSGADITALDESGFSCIHGAAQHGKTAALDYLQRQGADIHLLDGNGRNALHWAAYKNSTITANWLIRQGADMSLADVGGRLPIHWACSKNNLEIVMLLVEEMQAVGDYSALEKEDCDGCTPTALAEQRVNVPPPVQLSFFSSGCFLVVVLCLWSLFHLSLVWEYISRAWHVTKWTPHAPTRRSFFASFGWRVSKRAI